MTESPSRFTLRQLPLPAKLVLSCFLISVGLGYFSALVQLHLQHSSREGEPLPSPTDVVEIFAGKKKADPDAAKIKPVSKLERLVMGPIEGAPWNGTGSMAAAFFNKDGEGYTRAVKENPGLTQEREGERKLVQAWIQAADAERKAAFEGDAFAIPEALASHPLTEDFRKDDKTVAIRSLLDARCTRCHRAGEAQESFPLETYDHFAKYMAVPPVEEPVNGWIRSDRQVSVEKLTQSTHAHLLSFSMLFMLTGLIFALTSYPLSIRCFLGPIVLIAQVADISCWWLARLDSYGPYFALAIIGTGGIVGLGVASQIVLSLFNMYGPKGKVVVFLLMAVGIGGFSVLYKQAIAPALQAQKDALSASAAPAEEQAPVPAKPEPEVAKAPEPEKPMPTPMPAAVTAPEPAPEPPPAPVTPPVPKKPATAPVAKDKPAVSQFERLILGPVKGAKWDGSAEGSMAPAFFHKDGAGYARNVKENPEVEKEREAERQVLALWIRATDSERKAAYEKDAFPMPQEWQGKPFTPEYQSEDKKQVLVQTIIFERCARCHCSGGEVEQYPLESYEEILKYLGPEKMK